MVKPIRMVLDTNVLVYGLRSRNGASLKLLSRIDDPQVQLSVSVPLVIEYEETLKRQLSALRMTATDVNELIDYLCSIAEHHETHYLWRPFLRDPGDDIVLELAVASESHSIVTFNIRDFASSDVFGIKAVPPQIILTK